MSTNSRIGKLLPDGTIKQIYCHYDGYVEGGVGETLVNHYSKVEDVNELLKLGDISVLTGELFPSGDHSFDKPESGITIAYGRDRGEKNVDAKIVSLDEWYSTFYSSGIEFYYLFEGKNWWVKAWYSDDTEWKLVASYLPTHAHSLTAVDYSVII